MDPSKDPLFRGEFPVVLALLEKLKGGKEAKNECDKVIDKNGAPKTGGTGIKQLRENIAESKLSYEIMDDAAQAFLKMKIMDNIHKYYYLIVFTAYMREAADAARNLVPDDKKAELTLTGGKCAIPANQLKLFRKFAAFMEENKKLIDLCETGKGNLQWERDPSRGPEESGGSGQGRLQGQPWQDHPRHLPDRPCHVLRHAPGRPQEARQVQVRLQDPDEDPAGGQEGRGGGLDREEDDRSRPVRDPWPVHLGPASVRHQLPPISRAFTTEDCLREET